MGLVPGEPPPSSVDLEFSRPRVLTRAHCPLHTIHAQRSVRAPEALPPCCTLASVYQSSLYAALPYLFKKQFLIFSPVFYSLSQSLTDVFGWWEGLFPWYVSHVKPFWHLDCVTFGTGTQEVTPNYSFLLLAVRSSRIKQKSPENLPSWRWEHTQLGARGKTQPLPPPSVGGLQRRSSCKTPWRTLEEKLRSLVMYLQKAPKAKGQILLWEEVRVPGPSAGPHWGNFKKQP